MGNILRYLTKRKILVVFSLLVVLYVVYFGFIQGLSFKVNGDFFAMLSTISAFKNYLSGNFDINVFPDALLYSPHTNIISWLIAGLSNIFKFDPLKAFYIISPIGILAFIFSFDYFLEKIKIQPQRRALIIITSIILVPIVTSFNYIGDGIFTLSDLIITTLGWRIFGFSLFFICLGLATGVMEKPTQKSIITLLVTSFLLSNIYLPNFIVLVFFMTSYLFFESVRQRSLVINIFTVFIFITIGGLLNLMVWPFYDLFSLLSQSYRDFQISPMIQNPDSYAVNSAVYYFNIMSVSLSGFLYIFKEKNTFIKISSIVCLLIILSSLSFPYFKIPYFWRFATFLKIFLIISTLKNIDLKIRSYSTMAIIALATTTLFIYTTQSLALIKNRSDNQGQLYLDLKKLDLSAGLILSDERTANTIQATGRYKTYAIPNGHVASREISYSNLAKIKKLNEVLRTYDYQKINQFFIENNIAYLAISQDAAFVETFKLINNNDFSFYPKVTQTAGLKILRITPLK